MPEFCFERVIIAEPVEFQRRILRLLFEDRGVENVVEVGPELLSDLGERDLVFQDAASFRPSSPAPSIATAGSKSDSALADAIRSGASAFMVKPYTKEGLDLALSDLELLKSSEARP